MLRGGGGGGGGGHDDVVDVGGEFRLRDNQKHWNRVQKSPRSGIFEKMGNEKPTDQKRKKNPQRASNRK